AMCAVRGPLHSFPTRRSSDLMRLLMVGDQDILAPIENVREHPLFLEGPTLVFRKAGHRFFYEDAQPFNDIAHHFLSQGRLPEPRSEEHTSELQSRFDLVCRLL